MPGQGLQPVPFCFAAAALHIPVLFSRGGEGRADPAPVTIPVRMFPLLPPGAGTVHRGCTVVGNFILQNHQLKEVLRQKLFFLAVKGEQVVKEGRVNRFAGAGGPRDSLICRPRTACTPAALPLPPAAHEEQRQDHHHVPPAQGALLAD